MSLEQAVLIEAIESFPCLWDLKNKDHKNMLVVENAWSTIAAISEGMSVEEVKDLWKSLRAKYIRERKNNQNLPSGSGGDIRTWTLYEKMNFLDPHIPTRKTKSNVVLKRKAIDQLESPSSVWSELLIQDDGTLMSPPARSLEGTDGTEVEVIEEVTITEGASSSLHSFDDNPEYSNSATPSTSTGKNKFGSKFSKKATGKEELTRIADTCTNVGESLATFLRQSQAESQHQDKEDYYFGLSLVENLSKIKNKKKKMILKSKILIMAAEAVSDSD